MKVVVLGTRGFPAVQGGVEKHCEELYPRLAALGCDVTVFARTPYLPKEDRLSEWKGVRFLHLWCPHQKAFEAITHTFIGILKARTLKPDILHIHAIGPSLLTPFARALGLKVVFTHHGPDYLRAKWGGMAKAILRQGEKFGVKYSHKIIAISEGIRRHIQQQFGANALFIPNGVSVLPPLPAGQGLRRWGLTPKGYAYTACRFVPEKGLHDLVDSYKSIPKPAFKLVIAGDADHETEYSRGLKRLCAGTDGVVTTGFISGPTLAELFSNAGLFVLPSYYEGLPIALLEALSYGLPVLASDIPQHREIPLSQKRYFPVGNVAALSQSLVEGFATGISTQERDRYVSLLNENYNWDLIAERTLEAYSEALSR
jgi:glycosyltransferase involved in cell wall biosynthesis